MEKELNKELQEKLLKIKRVDELVVSMDILLDDYLNLIKEYYEKTDNKTEFLLQLEYTLSQDLEKW